VTFWHGEEAWVDVDGDLRVGRFGLGSPSSQIHSRPSLRQPPHGCWPEHRDFLLLQRRQTDFVGSVSGLVSGVGKMASLGMAVLRRCWIIGVAVLSKV
jgi:hypothetical protein